MPLIRRSVNLGAVSLLLMLAAGCASDRESQMHIGADSGKTAVSAPVATTGHAVALAKTPAAVSHQALAGDDYDETSPKKLSPIADREPDRYLIKNATLTLEAPQVREVTDRVVAAAKRLKGYVSGLHETVDALGTRSVTFTVRVPATEFDTFLQGFEAQGKVMDREVTAEDVTEEFVDTQSKLHNLRATESRLLSHLSKTGKLSDTLLVETEINRVREESDKLTGRLKFLAHRISYSTFTVTIKETAHAQAITPPQSFSAGRVATDSVRSLVEFGQGVLTLSIWLLTWSVVWLPPVLIAGYVRWRRRAAPSRVG